MARMKLAQACGGSTKVNQIVHCLRYLHFQNIQDNLVTCKNIVNSGKCITPNPKDTVSRERSLGTQGTWRPRRRPHLEQVFFPLIALYFGTQDGGTGPQRECQAQKWLRLAPAQPQRTDLDHGVTLRLRENAYREENTGTSLLLVPCPSPSTVPTSAHPPPLSSSALFQPHGWDSPRPWCL